MECWKAQVGWGWSQSDQGDLGASGLSLWLQSAACCLLQWKWVGKHWYGWVGWGFISWQHFILYTVSKSTFIVGSTQIAQKCFLTQGTVHRTAFAVLLYNYFTLYLRIIAWYCLLIIFFFFFLAIGKFSSVVWHFLKQNSSGVINRWLVKQIHPYGFSELRIRRWQHQKSPKCELGNSCCSLKHTHQGEFSFFAWRIGVI